MALEDTSAPQQNTAQQFGGGSSIPQQPMPSQNNPFGFSGVQLTPGRMVASPIRGQMGAESYVKLAKKLKEIAKDQNSNQSLEVLVLEMDRSVDPNLHFACFVFTAQSTTAPKLGVGYNIVIMEATGETLKPLTETINNESIEIPRFTETAADQKLVEISKEMLRNRFGNDVPFFSSDTQVVPTDFDHEKEDAVRGLAINAAMAAAMSLTMFAGNGQYFTDLNLVKELKNRRSESGDADLSFLYSFHPQISEDILKLPTRASVVIQSATGYRKSQRNESLHSSSGQKTLSETCGFVELMPIAPRMQMMQYPQLNQYGQVPPRLAPVFVLTKLATSFSFSPGAMVMNVLVASDLNKGFGWVSAFANKTKLSGNSLDLADVTAITIDMPSKMNPAVPESRPAVPASGQSIDTLMSFLGTYCFPDLNIAIDVPLASASSWHLSIFAQAATGNQNAILTLNRAMELLTDNHFLKVIGKDLPIFSTAPLVIERGYWIDQQTNLRRPIEEIDFVAVCNYADANNNTQIVERWTNSFLQLNRSQASRLRDRREIIQEVTGHTATFVGRSVRCFFNGKWLAGGIQALSNAGITIASDGRGNFGFGGGRGFAEFLTGSAMPTGAGWANAFGGGNGTFNYGSMTSNPWGA